METDRKVRVIEDEDGLWAAIDEETGVASSGQTRLEAIEMLDEAVALHKGEIGRPVTDDDLREWGIDPESVPGESDRTEPPWFDAGEE